MKLIQKTKAQQIAFELQTRTENLISHVESELTALYSAINTDGEQQAILDEFGTNAINAIQAYIAFQTPLAAIKQYTTAPIADLTSFQPQADGTVVYVEPVESND